MSAPRDEAADLPGRVWWGRFVVPQGAAGSWAVGPFRLCIRRRRGEWDVSVDGSGDAMDETLRVQVPLSPPETPGDPPDLAAGGAQPETATRLRFAAQDEEDALFIGPLLADRPVVARPETPFHLLGRHETTIYLSQPVWVRLEAGDPPGTLVVLPTFVLKDTWFGPSPREGELCYATRTAARLDLDDFRFRPARAVTEVRIRNRAAATLAFERVNLPTPSLSLFHDRHGRLWTESVTVERPEAGDTAHIRIGGAPPAAAESAVLLAKPRQQETRGVLERAMGMLFG